jgi:hypothetical protein
MGSAYSRNQASNDKVFESGPTSLSNWDVHHLRLLHTWFTVNALSFRLEKWEWSRLLEEALPVASAKAPHLWTVYAVTDEDGTSGIYPVEVLLCLLMQCRGQSR